VGAPFQFGRVCLERDPPPAYRGFTAFGTNPVRALISHVHCLAVSVSLRCHDVINHHCARTGISITRVRQYVNVCWARRVIITPLATCHCTRGASLVQCHDVDIVQYVSLYNVRSEICLNSYVSLMPIGNVECHVCAQ